MPCANAGRDPTVRPLIVAGRKAFPSVHEGGVWQKPGPDRPSASTAPDSRMLSHALNTVRTMAVLGAGTVSGGMGPGAA